MKHQSMATERFSESESGEDGGSSPHLFFILSLALALTRSLPATTLAQDHLIYVKLYLLSFRAAESDAFYHCKQLQRQRVGEVLE
jgi:hypothetical protein